MDTRKRRAALIGRAEATVAAPVEAVWRVIADVTRTGEWSHECRHVAWLDGAVRAAPGVRFRGRNRSRWLRWSRTCEMLAVDPPTRIAWRTIATPLFVDSTEWSVHLEPAAAGTRIVQEYRVTRCPQWWEWIAIRLIPGHIDRTAALTNDLRRIGAVAEADAPAADPGSSR
jgi:uncharacterized protein YndB with AHSA1/START domain